MITYKHSKKFYYLYKITNNINQKIYYGVHGTNNIDDGYMGSGGPLGRAKKKYGIENFTKEILEFFDNPILMAEAESNIVTQEFISDSSNYNAVPGGGYLAYGKRANTKNISLGQIKYQKSRTQAERSESMRVMGSKQHWTPERKESWKNKLSLANKNNPNCSIASQKVWQNISEEKINDRNMKISQSKINLYASLDIQTKRDMLNPALQASMKRLTCEHCGKTANTGNYSRWHGDNCKKRFI